MNKNLFFVLCLVFLISSIKRGQAQYNKILHSVTVNPSQLDVHQSKSARSMTIITDKDIEKMAASSVEEVLSNIEGINNNGRGGFGVQNDLGMRGGTFSQVLILIDNVRMNEGLTGHYNMYLPIALSEIAKIEVVRGPAASAYGADAVGGLIHIKTKTYLAGRYKKNKDLGSTGSILIGENKLRVIDAMLESKNDKLYFSGSLNVKSSLGQAMDNPNYVRDSSLDKNYRTDFDIKNYSLSANYFLGKKTNLFARVALNTRNFNAKYFYTNSTYDESVETVNTIWTQAGLQHRSKNKKSQLGIAYKQLGDEFVFNPLFAKNNHTTNNVVAYAQQQRHLGNLQLAYGLQSVFQKITSSDRGNHTNNTYAAFASINWDIHKKMNVNASGRLEYNTNYNYSFVPQLGLSYRPKKNMVLRTSIGMAHRAPDFTERYVSTNLPSLSAERNIGNPNLKVEQSITADVGFDYFTKSEKLFSVSIFARDGSNLIDYVQTNSDVINTTVELVPNSDYFYTQNITSAFTYGAELGIQKRFRIKRNSKFRIGLNYTYLQTTTQNKELSKYISNHPAHMANLIIGYESKYLDINIANQFRQRKPEISEAVFGEIPENYLITNALMRIKLLKGKLGLIGKALNLFDTEYQEILGAPMPRRWFAAGIDWKF